MQQKSLIYQLPGIQTIKMLHVPGGTFTMGNGSDDDNPAHEVRLDDFYLCEFPVTQDLYEAIKQTNPSYFNGNRHPVEKVSWYDAIDFCNLLSEKLGMEKIYTIDKDTEDKNNKNEYDDIKWLVKMNHGAQGFRLPTEAEWEYAAKFPIKKDLEGIYAGSNRLEQVGWFNDNNAEETREVGLKFSNQLGLYDMTGNVFEWCWDWYGEYNQKDRDNPTGTKTGSERVIRGGYWNNEADSCRVVYRFKVNNNTRYRDIGFRIALSF